MKSNVIYTRESGLQFTHIKIKPIIKNKKYVALFTFTYNNKTNMVDTTINGKSHNECLLKTEKFLNTKLDQSEYTIIK